MLSQLGMGVRQAERLSARPPSAVLSDVWSQLPIWQTADHEDMPFSGAAWRLVCSRPVTFPVLDCSILWIALSDGGRQSLKIDGREAVVSQSMTGQVRLFPAGSQARIDTPGGDEWSGAQDSLHLYLLPSSFEVLGLNPRPALRRPGPEETDVWLLALMRRLSGLDGEPAATGAEASHLGLAALARVAQRFSEPSSVEPDPSWAKGGLAGWQLKRVLEFINDDLSRALTVSELAGLCQLSPFHFARAFRHSVGRPPRRYVIERRLEMARHLLEQTTRSVTDIALAVGYAESGHLARAFRHAHGIAPAEYRRQR